MYKLNSIIIMSRTFQAVASRIYVVTNSLPHYACVPIFLLLTANLECTRLPLSLARAAMHASYEHLLRRGRYITP